MRCACIRAAHMQRLHLHLHPPRLPWLRLHLPLRAALPSKVRQGCYPSHQDCYAIGNFPHATATCHRTGAYSHMPPHRSVQPVPL